MKTNVNKTILHRALIVRQMTEKRSRTFGIYRGPRLIEGGFFSLWSAQATAQEYREGGEQVIAIA